MYPSNYPDPMSIISSVPFSPLPETTVASTSITSACPRPCKGIGGGKQLFLQAVAWLLYLCPSLSVPPAQRHGFTGSSHCGASNVRVRAIYLLYDAESCIRMACASCGLSWRSQLRADGRVGWGRMTARVLDRSGWSSS